MEKVKKCTSCKVDIANLKGSVKFSCPGCGEHEIIRCKHCREIAARYKCICEFTGPY